MEGKKLRTDITRIKWLVLLSAFVFTPSLSHAFGSWNQETTARELCFLFSLSTDWKQTLDISKNPNKFSEANPILAKK